MNPQATRGPKTRISDEDLQRLYDWLQSPLHDHGIAGNKWTRRAIASLIKTKLGLEYHQNHIPRLMERMVSLVLDTASEHPHYRDGVVTLYLGNAESTISHLPSNSIDCIVTSPPYYGQRDYGVTGQLGLEENPEDYVAALVRVFREAKRALKESGSLWVNLGDTYWSGKGKSHSADAKGRYRRFLRPQDRTGQKPLCVPKQLLLIPHRFAIAMQAEGWIVRNDNIWYKVNPTPDPVDDRCASGHEYFFHFVKSRRYYFHMESVAEPSNGDRATKAPSSVWRIRSAPTFKKHIAVFPEELVRIPILATLPPDGILLDPFCGSGTALSYALEHSRPSRLIGIDISKGAISEAAELLSAQLATGPHTQ